MAYAKAVKIGAVLLGAKLTLGLVLMWWLARQRSRQQSLSQD